MRMEKFEMTSELTFESIDVFRLPSYIFVIFQKTPELTFEKESNIVTGAEIFSIVNVSPRAVICCEIFFFLRKQLKS